MIYFPPAKINLGLKILGKREDGFHEIQSLFLPINWCDVLEVIVVENGEWGKLNFTCSGIEIPEDNSSNTVVRAHKLLSKNFNLPEIDAQLLKIIPIGAGLGGGSSDGSFMLKAINELCKLGVSNKELKSLASELGSDCPFFIDNIPSIVSGRGEIIDPLPFSIEELNINKLSILLIHPGIHVNTGVAFTLLNQEFNNKKLPDDFISIDLYGSAGQSFGAFGIQGLKLRLFGDANDYVGKGLSGAKLVILPPKESNLKSDENTIIGNTVLYGATSGKLFASGKAGERFAVRNSGALSVIEGCNSNGCEYMTGGVVVILGKVGDNFAAGMTGGMAFIYDPLSDFEKYINSDSVVWQKIETEYWIKYVKSLIQEHYSETNSELSKKIIDNFKNEILNFVQVCPKEMIDKLENPITLKPMIKEVS